MKKKLLIATVCLFSLSSLGQDTNLFQTWYLTEIAADFEPSIFINEITPPINPDITILEDLTFEGNGACNGFIGNFIYNSDENSLFAEEFTHTLVVCEIFDHDEAEGDYFAYLRDEPLTIDVSPTNLFLTLAPGFYLAFQNEPLSITDVELVKVVVYPNPVSNQLFVTSEGIPIESIAIFDVSGKRLLITSHTENAIDVSNLPTGIYFLEALSENGKTAQQFIKL